MMCDGLPPPNSNRVEPGAGAAPFFKLGMKTHTTRFEHKSSASGSGKEVTMLENSGLDLEFLKNVAKSTRHLDELVENTDRIATALEELVAIRRHVEKAPAVPEGYCPSCGSSLDNDGTCPECGWR